MSQSREGIKINLTVNGSSVEITESPNQSYILTSNGKTIKEITWKESGALASRICHCFEGILSLTEYLAGPDGQELDSHIQEK